MEDRRIVVVTGGNRGLGRETCARLAREDFRVVLTARNAHAAHEAAKDLGVDQLQLDVSDEASIARAASERRLLPRWCRHPLVEEGVDERGAARWGKR